MINNFGQFNHLIHRALRDLDIDVSMVPNSTPPEQISEGCRGIILGGGPTIERAGNSCLYLDLGIPVLGICLGLHIIATKFGGDVQQGPRGGYGPIEVDICEHDDILSGTRKRSMSGLRMPMKLCGSQMVLLVWHNHPFVMQRQSRFPKNIFMGFNGILKSVTHSKENASLKILTESPGNTWFEW